ncbi:MAG: substrate-binding domain-containing protein [Bacteroidetes bacterium]|nr:substrate-binding domain-containing protein [Bacteroidota bacterium]
MKHILIIALSVMFFAACHEKPKGPTDTLTSGEIQLAAADNFQNLINAAVRAFHAHYPQAFVFPLFVPETEAIQLLIDDSVRIAITTRDLTDAERQKLTKNRVVRKYLFAFEGIAIVGNKASTDTLLTVAQLKKILLGEITDWKQINPKSNAGTIQVLFDNQKASVLNYLTDSLLQGNKNVSPNLYAAKGIDDLRERIAAMPNAIAIVGLNQLGNETTNVYKEFMAKTRFVWIAKDETAKPALPYAGDLHKDNYPLWRPIYILLSELRNGLPKGFGYFLTDEVGQKIVLKAGLMPISDPQNILIQITE